jgi:O-succinylbenzoate synthase
MRLESIDIIRVELPLVSDFRTSHGLQSVRDIMLVRAHTSVGDGWGECVVQKDPFYTEEFIDAAHMVLERWLVPTLVSEGDFAPEQMSEILHNVKGHRGTKASLEMALLDAQLRADGRSLADYLGGTQTHVDVGVSVGITDTIEDLVAVVRGYVAEGYGRVKLKIEPGFDFEPVAAVRAEFPNLRLQVDANGSYRSSDVNFLQGLDKFDLLLVEQPFEADDLQSHQQLAACMDTPVCLDESIVSLRSAIDALDRRAASILNIKPGRVGGLLESKAIHDECQSRNIPVWCGGMLESGVGRAANIALASLPNFTLPGDISATDRYFSRDITENFVLEGSTLAVPTGPGLGITVDEYFLRERGAEIINVG